MNKAEPAVRVEECVLAVLLKPLVWVLRGVMWCWWFVFDREGR